MADISTITLPDGNSYNFRDSRVATATTSSQGIVQPDGTTITISNGVISSVGGAAVDTATATLTTAGWSNLTQTITVQGVTASNTVIVSSDPSSMSAYIQAGVYCSAQASNSLTFKALTLPTVAITVNIVISD